MGVMVVGKLTKSDGSAATVAHQVTLDGTVDYTVNTSSVGDFAFVNVTNGTYVPKYKDPQDGSVQPADLPTSVQVSGAPVGGNWKGSQVRYLAEAWANRDSAWYTYDAASFENLDGKELLKFLKKSLKPRKNFKFFVKLAVVIMSDYEDSDAEMGSCGVELVVESLDGSQPPLPWVPSAVTQARPAPKKPAPKKKK